MRRLVTAGALAALAAALLTGVFGLAAARAEGPSGGLEAYFVDSAGRPLFQVAVTVVNPLFGIEETALTGEKGVAVLRGLPVGLYALKAAKHGYEAHEAQVQIKAGEQARVEAIMPRVGARPKPEAP